MHLRLLIAFIFAGLVVSDGFAQDKSQPTVDEFVAKNIEAKGGATALHDLQSLRLTGKLLVQVGAQVELAYLQIKKRGDEVRTEASLQGMTQIQAYDGKEGWRISPFFGRRDPERMSADDVKALVEDAEMDGPLVDWQAKGNAVEYLGTEDVDGTASPQVESDSEERRRKFRVSGSRPFSGDSCVNTTDQTGRIRRSRNRPGRL